MRLKCNALLSYLMSLMFLAKQSPLVAFKSFVVFLAICVFINSNILPIFYTYWRLLHPKAAKQLSLGGDYDSNDRAPPVCGECDVGLCNEPSPKLFTELSNNLQAFQSFEVSATLITYNSNLHLIFYLFENATSLNVMER